MILVKLVNWNYLIDPLNPNRPIIAYLSSLLKQSMAVGFTSPASPH